MDNFAQIQIDRILKEAAADLMLGVITADVVVVKDNPSLWSELEPYVRDISFRYRLDQLTKLPEIERLRTAYAALGKEPSRYRGSQEALLRRIVQGKGLYRINSIVDINNFVSLKSLHSCGVYDTANITWPAVFRVGVQGESYKGIGKEIINIEGLPVFADSSGPFGSPTSDSERAMISLATRSMMMIIIDFTGGAHLIHDLEFAVSLLERCGRATNICTSRIS